MSELIIIQKEQEVPPYLGGRPTKYSEARHLQLLYDVFNAGRGVMGFCADAMINRQTFYNWLKEHENFKRAYEIVINIAGDKWERWPIEALKLGAFNFQYWHIMMRNRFHYSGINIPELTENSTQGKFEAAWQGLAQGSLTPSEYNQTATGITAELKGKELELKSKELELQQKSLEAKNTDILSQLPPEARKAVAAIFEGKKVKICDEQES